MDEKLQDLKKRLDAETEKYEDGERVSKSELIGVGYELIELVEEQQKEIERFQRTYENTGAMFNRQNMNMKIAELERENKVVKGLLIQTITKCNQLKCTPEELGKFIKEDKVDFGPFEDLFK